MSFSYLSPFIQRSPVTALILWRYISWRQCGGVSLRRKRSLDLERERDGVRYHWMEERSNCWIELTKFQIKCLEMAKLITYELIRRHISASHNMKRRKWQLQQTYPLTPAFYLPPGSCHHQSSVIRWLRIICTGEKERKGIMKTNISNMFRCLTQHRFVKQTNPSLRSSLIRWLLSASFDIWTDWGLLLMRNRFSGMGGISSGRTVDVTNSSCSFSSTLSASDLGKHCGSE